MEHLSILWVRYFSEENSLTRFFVAQAQLVVLSAQIAWSENVESALNGMGGGGDNSPLQSVLANVEVTLNVLADSVLMEQPPLRRRKLEHLVSKTTFSLLGLQMRNFFLSLIKRLVNVRLVFSSRSWFHAI